LRHVPRAVATPVFATSAVASASASLQLVTPQEVDAQIIALQKLSNEVASDQFLVIVAQSASSLVVVVVVALPPQHHKLILEKLRNQKNSRNFAMIAVNMSQVSVHSVRFVILTHFQILRNIKQRQLRT
jgi:hypothetical protein